MTRRRAWRMALCLALPIGVPMGLPMAQASAQASAQLPGATLRADSAFARARALVTEGNGAAGRALVDSVLQSNKPGTPVFIEGLWWRAVLAEQAATAEKDLLRLAIEHPASPRAPEALLRLGQLELARGARDAAARHFERVVTEHPDSPLVAQAWLGRGRALLEAGRTAEGCSALSAARRHLTPTQVELRNQLDFQAQRCVPDAAGAEPSAMPAAPAPSAPVPASAAPRLAPSAAAVSGPRMRVAAGTYPTRAKATAQLRVVERAGFEGRVGTAGPGKFRVFVGEAMSRAEAQALAARLTKAKVKGVTVLAADP